MMKVAKSETIALEKRKQRTVTRKTNQLKKNLKSGKIILRENRKQKKLQQDENHGLVYIGHLPHGFYEEEIKKYFKQFGKVTNVKVCRSKNSGRSKGYGYVEFMHPEVAKVAAETMNNYIMFKKRLIAEFVPNEKRPKAIFQGKQSTEEKYTKQKRRHRNNLCRNKGIDKETHLKQSKTRISKLKKKLEKINKLGIDYEITPVDVPQELSK